MMEPQTEDDMLRFKRAIALTFTGVFWANSPIGRLAAQWREELAKMDSAKKRDE